MAIPVLTKAFDVGAAVNPYRIVKLSADYTVIQATGTTSAMIGVSGPVIAAVGDHLDVILVGTPDVMYGGSVTRGALLTSDSVGKAVSASAGDNTIGRALVSGSDGDIFPILLGAGGTVADDTDIFVDVTVTSAQVLALYSVPKVLVAAPGLLKAIIPLDITIYKPAGTAYAGIAGGEDLEIRYTDGSGQLFGTVETTGFLDQATAQTRHIFPLAAAASTPVANAALILCLASGEITTGDSALKVRVHYRIIDTQY